MKINQTGDCIFNRIIKIYEIMVKQIIDVDWRVNVPVKKSPAQYRPDYMEILFGLFLTELQRAIPFPVAAGN